MPTQRINLERPDVLALLDIASGMQENAISRLLTKFCNASPHVRFASVWRVNQRAQTISIYARSESDYQPQLGPNNEMLQEFLCSATCSAVDRIIQAPEFKSGHRANYSIRSSNIYGIFHPKGVVEQYDLDHFVALPIQASHAPLINSPHELPRFFCLFYCNKETNAEFVDDIDLEIVRQCLGNMIYNRFNENRWQTISHFTRYLADHADPEQPDLLSELKRRVPCENVFEITSARGSVAVAGARDNPKTLSHKSATTLWNKNRSDGASLLSRDEVAELGASWIQSAIVYEIFNHEASNRATILFCNRRSSCPLKNSGREFFTDDFGFDDVDLASAVGAHVRAFTVTRAERKRRDDVTRIIAHEIKQPLIDIRNSLSKFEHYPGQFGLKLTLARVKDSTNLAILLAEMNTELSDPRMAKAAVSRANHIEVYSQLEQMKLSMRGQCEDFDFSNDAISLDVSRDCRQLTIPRALLATIFINTVSNSIKYSSRKFEKSWCSFRVFFAEQNDPIWDQALIPQRQRRPGIMFTTTDNGIGVPKNRISEVFEKEIRLPSAMAVPGLGLGLYHLRRTIESLDGRVWLSVGESDSTYSTRVLAILPGSLARR